VRVTRNPSGTAAIDANGGGRKTHHELPASSAPATLSYFQVWAYHVARGTVGVGEPLDFSQRLDHPWNVNRDAVHP
jgi:hypothetical protein